MKKTAIGFIAFSLLAVAGCSSAPPPTAPSPMAPKTTAPVATPSATASMSASPSAMAASGSPTPGAETTEQSAEVKKLIEDTGVSLAVPAGFTQKVNDKGEIKLEASGLMGEVVLAAATGTMAEAFDKDLAEIKGLAGTSLKPDEEPKEMEHEGLKVKTTSGSFQLKGDKTDYEYGILTIDGGKKPLRVVVSGKDVKKDANISILMNSIKKK